MREEIEKTISVLKRGGLILYPTDTVWGIGCDATNADAVDKIFALKQRADTKALICLVSDFKMLNQYVEEIPEMAYDILKYADQPTTIIYPDPIRVASNVIHEDNTLGIRVCRNTFCNLLIKKFRKPLVATSANLSDEPTPMHFKDISQVIKDSVDYIVQIKQNSTCEKPSTIIKLDLDGKVQVIRK